MLGETSVSGEPLEGCLVKRRSPESSWKDARTAGRALGETLVSGEQQEECLVKPSRIRYEITSGNIGGAFAVKNMTGAIYVAGALDYETRKRVSTRLERN
uniref:Uncharacterized protein n=1 Tax=Timema tahoe TaxID=61484 RepID=A0A7R9FL85_9NEOP|nr:unnamed protein product [Timema tahoe]